MGFSLSDNNGAIFENCNVLSTAIRNINTNQIGYKINTCQAIWLRRCMADTLDSYGFHILGNSGYFYISDCSTSLCSGHQFYIQSGDDIVISNCYVGGRNGIASALTNQDGINVQSASSKVIILNTRITNCSRDG